MLSILIYIFKEKQKANSKKVNPIKHSFNMFKNSWSSVYIINHLHNIIQFRRIFLLEVISLILLHQGKHH